MMSRRVVVLSLPALALAACDRSRKFHGTDIGGVTWGRDFALTDHTGQRRALTDFRGQVVMLFFGFTNCPDVCPTALTEMAQVVERLGSDGKRVQGLFVTVDPERDTADVLAKYVPAFHRSFLGLRGSVEETARIAQDFKVYFRLNRDAPGAHAAHYTVDHSAPIFIYDTAGRLRLLGSANGRSVAHMVDDVRRLPAASEAR